jgi:2-polyprenyl-3-methyl-5-hydroxy-6-metoxy-1,4-benzoquinol methylase
MTAANPTVAVAAQLDRCNLCGSTQFHTRFFKVPYTRVQCDNCGLVWSLEQPDFAALEEMYGAEYFQGATYLNYVNDQPIIEENARKRLREIQKYVQPPGKVIEVGCAAGFFLNVCRAAGWETQGVELSDYASQFAREQLKLDVITGTLDDAPFAPNSAELVTLFDVIEHVPDPKLTLQQSAALLKPGGLLVISTGDVESLFSRIMGARWRLITYDHLFYFSVKTLSQYLESVGLEVVQAHHPGRLVSPKLVAHMLLNHYVKLPALRPALMKAAGILPNLSLNFFDVMTLYARKPAP